VRRALRQVRAPGVFPMLSTPDSTSASITLRGLRRSRRRGDPKGVHRAELIRWVWLTIVLLAAGPSCRNGRQSPRAPSGGAAVGVSGVWTGSYVCGQGTTGVRLTIKSTTSGVVEGAFEFFPTPDNPTVPAGSFAVKGSYVAGKMVLAGEKWINRPRGYEMVGLSGTFSGEARSFSGRVLYPGCSTFVLRITDGN
jgi:hypothetical protein